MTIAPAGFVSLETIRLYAEWQGEGPPLLFISGTGGDLRKKPNLFDGPLPKAFTTLSYDQRGLGQSGKPKASQSAPYTMKDYAEDAAALMEAAGWKRAHVMGVSFGGMVAQELAIRFPEKVDKLVLACTSPGGDGGASYPLHALTHMSGEERARHMIPISDTRHGDDWAKAHPEHYEELVRMAADDPYAGEPGHSEGALAQLKARAAHDTWDRLGAIKAPTLICGGKYDGIALPETQEKLQSRIAGAKLEMFEGGHLFLLQDRRAFKEIMAFLKD